MAAPREYRPLTLADAYDEYIQHLNRRVAAGTLSPLTLASYSRDLTEHIQHLGADRLIDDIDTDEIDDAVLEWSLSPDRRHTDTTLAPRATKASNTLTRHVASVRAWYGWADSVGLLRRNPVHGMAVSPKPIRPAGRRKALPSGTTLTPGGHEGWRGDYLQARDEAVLRLLLETGARVAELCALNVTDVDEKTDGPWLHIQRGKGGKPRDIPLHPSTYAFVARDLHEHRPPPYPGDTPTRQKDSERALLVTVRGRRITPRTVQNIVDDAARRAGVSTTPHGLRHTMATILVSEKGVGIAVVQRLLGHSSPTVTASAYIDDITPALRAAIEA